MSPITTEPLFECHGILDEYYVIYQAVCVCVCDAAVNALYMWLLSVSSFACGDHHKRLPYANIIVTFSKRKRQYFDGQGLP